MRSDHTAILPSFIITAIKFKVNEKVVVYIDWKLIEYHKLTNELFNNSLFKSIAGGTTHSKYKNHILEAGTNTATTSNQKNKVWFHFSRDSLLPFIEERDALISDYQTLCGVLYAHMCMLGSSATAPYMGIIMNQVSSV